MTNIHMDHLSSWNKAAGKRTAGDRLTRINGVTFWLLATVLALAPIPFGSARAIYWAVLAIVMGLMATAYFGTLVLSKQTLRISVERFAPQAAIWGITCLWLVIQALPVIGMPVVLSDGSTVMGSSISVAPGATILMLARQLTYGIFFFLMLQAIANERRRSLLFNVLLCIIVAHGIYGMVSLQSGDTILGMQKWAYRGFATGTFVNRNSYATFLAMGSIIAIGRFGAVLALGIAWHRDDGRPRNYWSSLILFGLAYAFLITVILSTASRMGIFVTVVGSLVALAVTLRGIRGKIMLMALFPAIFAGIVLGMIFFGSGLFERIGGVEGSAIVRGDFYRQIWNLILMRPLTGFGGGSFEIAYPVVHAAPVDSDKVWNLAHNTYLALWSELGLVVGTLVILSILLVTIKILQAIILKRGNIESQAIALGVIVACGLHALVDFGLEIPANTLIFLAIVAAGAASTVNVKAKGQ